MTLPQEERVREFCLAMVTPEFGEREGQFMDDMVAAHMSTATDAFGRQFVAIATFDSYDRLPLIQAPTLIIHGDRDIVIAPANAAVLSERIPNAHLQMIGGVGHMFTWERPAESADIIVKFLASVPQPV
jgi:pimeloyl-ACP methyl ester carboxylesterase